MDNEIKDGLVSPVNRLDPTQSDIEERSFDDTMRGIRAHLYGRPPGNIRQGPCRRYAFFSAENNFFDKGFPTDRMLDADGKTVLVNYRGPMIDGFPGFIGDGNVIRPPRYKTYEVVGEIGGPVREQLLRYERRLPPSNSR